MVPRPHRPHQRRSILRLAPCRARIRTCNNLRLCAGGRAGRNADCLEKAFRSREALRLHQQEARVCRARRVRFRAKDKSGTLASEPGDQRNVDPRRGKIANRARAARHRRRAVASGISSRGRLGADTLSPRCYFTSRTQPLIFNRLIAALVSRLHSTNWIMLRTSSWFRRGVA